MGIKSGLKLIVELIGKEDKRRCVILENKLKYFGLKEYDYKKGE